MIVLMSLSQFYTQRQLMTKNVDTTVKTPFMQQQKMLMYVFPVIFAVFGINFPVGVLVYWLTTNVWTMGQQMYVIRQNPTPGSKAQGAYLERLLKQATNSKKIRSRRDRAASSSSSPRAATATSRSGASSTDSARRAWRPSPMAPWRSAT